jgi:hypothetical protein
LNFKVLFYFSIFSTLISCGLKTTPRAPKGTMLPSLPNQYSKTYSKKKAKESKKIKKKNDK